MSERNVYTNGGNSLRMLAGRVKRRAGNVKARMRKQVNVNDRRAARREVAAQLNG